MAKTRREKDRVLQMINERASEHWPDEISRTATPEACDMWESHWNYCCEHLADEAIAKGLVGTAKEIMSWRTTKKSM